MDKSKIKEKLMNELGDKLNGLEMDVTNSFLNGKICSPLVMTANKTAAYLQGTAANAKNTLNKAGIYITKDGLNYDPTVMTEMAGKIVNSAINLTASELVRLKDKALKEITYIPDPSIIVKKAVSYFAYDLQHGALSMDSLLDFTNCSKKSEERTEKHSNKTIEKVKKWVDNKIPPINEKIEKISYNVNKAVNDASYYMSFGPEWVTTEMTNIIGDGSYVAEQYVNEQIETINNWKMQQYDKAAYWMSQQMMKQYENLIKQNLKENNDEVEKNKTKAKIFASTQIQKANLAIMAKTGIRIPIEKVTPENYNKIKRNIQISKLLGLAAQATPSNGPDSSNEKPSGEKVESVEGGQGSTATDPKYEKYSQEYFKELYNGLKKLYDYASSLSRKYDRKIQYEWGLTEEDEDYYYDLIDKLDNIAYDANDFSSQIEVYDRLDPEKFFHDETRRKNAEYFGGWNLGENVDEFVKNITDLLSETMITDEDGNVYSWDNEVNDYVETKIGKELEGIDVIGQGNNNSVPEMYNQTFMDFTAPDNSNTEI